MLIIRELTPSGRLVDDLLYSYKWVDRVQGVVLLCLVSCWRLTLELPRLLLSGS